MIFSLILAVSAVLPADRLAMADRLFNRGDYVRSFAEYSSLSGEKTIAKDELLYRLGECSRMLGKKQDARRYFGELIDGFPMSKYTAKARLARALSGTEDEQRAELRLLDSDQVEASVRSAALYRLGTLVKDAGILLKSVKAEPNGRYAAYANFHRASILSKSADAKDRREAVSSLLAIAFGSDKALAEEALNLAAVQCYSEKRYSESASLFKRYLKNYPEGKYLAESRRMAAWSEYLSGRYTEAIQLCGEGKSDDLSYLRAVCTQALGDGARAAKYFESYLEDYPEGRYRDSARLPLARIGFALAEKAGDAARAVECAKNAYNLSSLPADGLRLAWAYENAGRTAEAAQGYAKVAKDNPKTADAAESLYRLALIDLRAGRWSAAELSLAEAVKSGLLGSREALANYWRGVAAMHLEHEAEGAEFLKKALDAGLPLDESREARLMIADCDFRAGRTEIAAQAYARLVAEGACDRMSAAKILKVGKLLNGENARICAKALIAHSAAEWRQAGYALLGRTEDADGSSAAALDAYRKAAAEKVEVEDMAFATLRLGELESRSGNYAAADKALKRAIELNSAHPGRRAKAYMLLAQNCLAQKDCKAARGYATVVVSLFSDRELCAEAEKILEKCGESGK